jgi:hypothetical protein
MKLDRTGMETMPHVTRDSLMTLEAYARARDEFRAKVMAHKKNRNVHLGGNVTLMFEDELTMRYQIQEMLRAEKIFEEEGIQDELDAYNPLIPDGSNLKATMLIEYPDVEQRRKMLAQLKGVEKRVWVQAAGCGRVYAIADEDLEREDEEKTSSVHFLRFELNPQMNRSLRQGAAHLMGIDQSAYQIAGETVAEPVRSSLTSDLRGS